MKKPELWEGSGNHICKWGKPSDLSQKDYDTGIPYLQAHRIKVAYQQFILKSWLVIGKAI